MYSTYSFECKRYSTRPCATAVINDGNRLSAAPTAIAPVAINEIEFDPTSITGRVEEVNGICILEDMEKPIRCSCHGRDPRSNIVSKCKNADCSEWSRLNEGQMEFIDLINRVADDKTIFPNDGIIAPEDFEEDSIFHLYNKTNKSAALFLNGMGGTGKTEILKYIQNHTDAIFYFFNIKHILLSDFYRHTCKLHTEYNGKFPSRFRRVRLLTIANICRDLKKHEFNEDTAYRDFSGALGRLRLEYSLNADERKADKKFCLCVIEEYSTICPAVFVIITKLIREISHKTIFIICGDKQQCGPIECSSESSSNFGKAHNEREALPRDLLELAKYIFGTERVSEYTLTKLVRSADDENLQRLITLMWTNPDQHIEDRKAMVRDFVKKFNISKDKVIDISNIAVEYEKLIVAHETGQRDYIDERLRQFEIPFKIIASANNKLNEIDKRLVDTLYETLSSKYHRDLLKNYIVRYAAKDHVQYLLVGFPYKVTKNLLRREDGSYRLPNGTILQLHNLEYGEDDKLKSAIVKDWSTNKTYRLFPSKYTTNNRLKNIFDATIEYTGFPIQLYCTENVFQIQGLTISDAVYLDCDFASNQYLYVMFSRFRQLSQLKAVINI